MLRSLLAAPFHAIGVVLMGIAMGFLAIGGVVENALDESEGQTKTQRWTGKNAG